MRRTIHKVFFAWSFDKEEAWLNEMAAKGLALVSVGYCKYIFEDSIPGEYTIRLELLENLPTHAESQQYIKFLEETGAEYLGNVIRWVYFKKKTEGEEFSLYSDNASRIKHLSRTLLLLAIISLINLCIGASNVSAAISSSASANLYMGLLCISFGLFTGIGFLKVYFKKRKLQKEHILFE